MVVKHHNVQNKLRRGAAKTSPAEPCNQVIRRIYLPKKTKPFLRFKRIKSCTNVGSRWLNYANSTKHRAYHCVEHNDLISSKLGRTTSSRHCKLCIQIRRNPVVQNSDTINTDTARCKVIHAHRMIVHGAAYVCSSIRQYSLIIVINKRRAMHTPPCPPPQILYICIIKQLKRSL